MKRKSDGTVEAPDTRLSSRGLAASSYGGTVTKEHHQAAAAPYDAKLRPDGYITLAVAQNSLMFDILEPKLLEMPPLTRKSCEYPPGWLGLPELRAEVASMFNKRVLRKSKLDAANVGILDSATAIVNMLAFVLCEPGDVIVTPAPFYASYKRDVEAFAQCRLAFASCGSEEDGFLPSVAGLEAAVATAKEAGQNVRCLLLSSPINPTGIVIPQQRLAELLMWARKHGLHIIADEVFALSIYGSSVASASILDEAEVASCGDVHVVWGFSKDFCLSGVRVGCLVSNSEVLKAVSSSLGVFAQSSVHSQQTALALLRDGSFVDSWVKSLQQRLQQSWESTREALQLAGIPVAGQPAAAHFILVDLREFLPADSESKESALETKLGQVARVLLTPGLRMGMAEPGWFRLCHASQPANVVQEAIRRIGRLRLQS